MSALKTVSPSLNLNMRFLKSARQYEALIWGNADGMPIGVYNRGPSLAHVLDIVYNKVKRQCLKAWKSSGKSQSKRSPSYNEFAWRWQDSFGGIDYGQDFNNQPDEKKRSLFNSGLSCRRCGANEMLADEGEESQFKLVTTSGVEYSILTDSDWERVLEGYRWEEVRSGACSMLRP